MRFPAVKRLTSNTVDPLSISADKDGRPTQLYTNYSIIPKLISCGVSIRHMLLTLLLKNMFCIKLSVLVIKLQDFTMILN